jgi:hypothetical protein
MNLCGVQLVPAEVRNPRDPFSTVHNYCFMHFWNRNGCLDREKSKLRTNRSWTRIFSIDALVLQEQVISKIELEKRVIFLLAEIKKPSLVLIHETMKQAILSLNPVGCRFISAEDWSSSKSLQ